MISQTKNNSKPPTSATSDLGNWLNRKLALYLGWFGKSEE